jgi:ornithine decarboxylase
MFNTVYSDEPLFIIDLGEVIRAYRRWKRCLPNVKPYYAMKCNPNHKIVNLLAALGCSFDCASKTEIEHILGVTNNDSSKIIFAHPCKYISHIKYAKQNGVDMLTFDSEEELYKIREHHPKARLLLRLAVDDSQSLCKLNIKFGCKLENARKLIEIAAHSGLNLIGFSFHVGSGCKSADTYYDALRICNKATDIAYEYGFNTEIIDIGGGFVAEHAADGVSFERIADKVNEGIDDFFGHTDIQFIAEPGRFMVQKSHTLVVCVIGKKKTDSGFIYYLNDGVYGSFNCIIFDHQEPDLIPVKMMENAAVWPSQIFGNTCDSLDEIKKNVLLPELQVGDFLYVKNFGAYTSSAKSDGFNGYKVNHFQYVNTAIEDGTDGLLIV